jgi:ketosteroid isomerase-like protein
MSQENVDAFQRAADAYNRGDIDTMLEGFHADVEWHAVFQVMFGGAATVCRGHGDVRDYVRELDEGLTDIHVQLTEIRDLGEERLLGIGRASGRGRASGAEIEAPIVFVVEYRDGKIFRMSDYLDPDEALEAAGLSE